MMTSTQRFVSPQVNQIYHSQRFPNTNLAEFSEDFPRRTAGALIYPPDEQKENLANLWQTIEGSIDNLPTREDVEEAIAFLQDVFSDGEVTPEEREQIVTGIRQAIDNLGITASETHDILLAAQDVVDASRLPQTPETLIGTEGNDFLWGKGGSDTLTGAVDDAGREDMDILLGGAGADTFVLGDEAQAFYDDGIAFTQGTLDAALIVDFNPEADTVQLHGDASNYMLGAIPDVLTEAFAALDGTALYKQGGKADELVGIFYGTEVTSFDKGFAFV